MYLLRAIEQWKVERVRQILMLESKGRDAEVRDYDVVGAITERDLAQRVDGAQEQLRR